MGLGDPAGEGQSEAGAAAIAGSGWVGTVEAVEDLPEALGRDPDPGVLDGNADDAAIASRAQPYPAAGVGVAHGVGDQRSEEAAQPRRFPEYRGRIVLDQ